jgi:predicted ATPase/DNA-binding SARP family transcriptional activator
MVTHTCTIELFSTLRVRREMEEITRFQTRQTRALLAYLAFYPRRAHRREEIIELFWPDRSPQSGQNSLRLALADLRRLLAPSPSERKLVLHGDHHTVALNGDLFVTDTALFEADLRTAACAPDEEQQFVHYRQAVARYRGALLTEFSEPWVQGERQRLADAYLIALRRLIQALVNRRDLDAALDCAHRALQADPLREESHRIVMQIYGAQGRPEAAWRQYQELTALYQEELGCAPSTRARELALRYAPSFPESATAFPPLPLASAPESTPPPAPLLGDLPASLPPLFGREQDVSEVCAMLQTSETRLVNLTGIPGGGKTRLAIAAAEALRALYPGGAWFVPLAALTDACRLPETLLRALRLPRSPDLTPRDQLLLHLSTQPILLVLDNFEHLAQEGAPILQALLDQAPTLTCLVTSRHRLRLPGEYEYAVTPLATPRTAGTPERLLEFASVQLFVDRVQAVRRDFHITGANAGAIAALCHHLEGLPLSLELAAAWGQTLTPAQILARLKPRLDLLVNRQVGAPARQASLRATLEWSYTLLPPDLQHFFACLSVFRGGWDLEAAEAVCTEAEPDAPLSRALEALTQLRERSLLSAEERGETMRFSLLETLREYATERLAAEDRPQVARRHALYYWSLAERAEAPLRTADAPAWLERLEAEHENFRAALEWALQDAGNLLGLELANALWRFWQIRGYYAEGAAWLSRALGQNPEAPDALRAQTLGYLGNLTYVQGDYTSAHACYEEMLSLRRALGDPLGIATALGSLGNVANDREDYASARRLFEESLALFRAQHHRRGVGITLLNLATVYSDEGDHRAARHLYEEGLTLFREMSDLHNVAQTLNNLVTPLLRLGDRATARSVLAENLALSQTLNSPPIFADCATGFARLALSLSDWQRSALLFGAAEALRNAIDAPLPAKALRAYEHDCSLLRAHLGEERFTETWSRGHVLSREALLSCLQEPLPVTVLG